MNTKRVKSHSGDRGNSDSIVSDPVPLVKACQITLVRSQ